MSPPPSARFGSASPGRRRGRLRAPVVVALAGAAWYLFLWSFVGTAASRRRPFTARWVEGTELLVEGAADDFAYAYRRGPLATRAGRAYLVELGEDLTERPYTDVLTLLSEAQHAKVVERFGSSAACPEGQARALGERLLLVPATPAHSRALAEVDLEPGTPVEVEGYPLAYLRGRVGGRGLRWSFPKRFVPFHPTALRVEGVDRFAGLASPEPGPIR